MNDGVMAHVRDFEAIGRKSALVQFSTHGSVVGRGKTKGEAYADAAGKIPDGATPGKASYVGSDSQGWTCWLAWTKN